MKETIPHGTPVGFLFVRLCTTGALILILAAVQSPIKEGKVERAGETDGRTTPTKKTVAADLSAEAAPPRPPSPPSPPQSDPSLLRNYFASSSASGGAQDCLAGTVKITRNYKHLCTLSTLNGREVSDFTEPTCNLPNSNHARIFSCLT